MAGNPGPLKRNARPYRRAFALAGLLAALFGTLAAGERTGDVLTVERPGRLVVLNKYQQRLTSAEERLLSPFIPMVVIREKDLLGDGFTPCASVEIDRERYYLLRDAEGELSSRGEPGKKEIFRDVTLFGDTVVLLGGKALDLKPAGGKDALRLNPGTRAVREFERGSVMYVRLTGQNGRFGWITPSRSPRAPEWRSAEPAAHEAVSRSELISRLRGVVDGANSSLRSVYAALSESTGKSRTPPSFDLKPSRENIRCVVEPDDAAGAFAGSLRALLPEFERVLGGTGLHAELAGGAILIPLR